MSSETGPLDGQIILPRRASFWAAATIVLALAAQIFGAGIYVAKIESRFDAVDTKIETRFRDLDAGDSRILKRGDDRYTEVRARLDALERDRNIERDRLVRLEEQGRSANELLREIRQEMRSTPRR